MGVAPVTTRDGGELGDTWSLKAAVVCNRDRDGTRGTPLPS